MKEEGCLKMWSLIVGMMWMRLNMPAQRKRESCWEWTLQVMRMPSLTTTSPSTDLENTRSGRQRTWICPRFCKHQWNIIQFLLTDSMSQCIIHQAKFISTCIHVILFRWWNHRLNSRCSPIYLESIETLIYCDIVHSSCSNCKMFNHSFISTVLEHLVSQFSNFLVIYTVLAEGVGYFVLLYCSHKSWSVFKTGDRFEFCWFWRFQGAPYMYNLTRFWLGCLRLKTQDAIILLSC